MRNPRRLYETTLPDSIGIFIFQPHDGRTGKNDLQISESYRNNSGVLLTIPRYLNTWSISSSFSALYALNSEAKSTNVRSVK